MSDPTEVDRAARKIASILHPHNWLDPERENCHECGRLAEIVKLYMQPVIDAARAEGVASEEARYVKRGHPTAANLKKLRDDARAEGRRERDEAKCSVCGNAQSHCAAVAHSNAEAIDSANAQWQKTEAALERVRALFPRCINMLNESWLCSDKLHDTDLWCEHCKIEEAIHGC